MEKTDFILLIDDDEATQVFHQIMAEESGVSQLIVSAYSTHEGIAQLERLFGENMKTGLVFLDINMPVSNGWDFLEMLSAKELDKNLRLSIIMVSASDHPKDLDKINAHPLLSGFEPKPILSDKIISWVKKFN